MVGVLSGRAAPGVSRRPWSMSGRSGTSAGQAGASPWRMLDPFALECLRNSLFVAATVTFASMVAGVGLGWVSGARWFPAGRFWRRSRIAAFFASGAMASSPVRRTAVGLGRVDRAWGDLGGRPSSSSRWSSLRIEQVVELEVAGRARAWQAGQIVAADPAGDCTSVGVGVRPDALRTGHTARPGPRGLWAVQVVLAARAAEFAPAARLPDRPGIALAGGRTMFPMVRPEPELTPARAKLLPGATGGTGPDEPLRDGPCPLADVRVGAACPSARLVDKFAGSGGFFRRLSTFSSIVGPASASSVNLLGIGLLQRSRGSEHGSRVGPFTTISGARRFARRSGIVPPWPWRSAWPRWPR